MAKNWVICIGINQYNLIPPLRYAGSDAVAVRDFLCREAGFNSEYVFLFAANVGDRLMHPTRTNLLRFLRQLTRKKERFGVGDSLWFFFSGHGAIDGGRDYLMPIDGDPEDPKQTAISIEFISSQLRDCGADNIILLVDACRSQGVRDEKGAIGMGKETADRGRKRGIVTITSCSPGESSYELDALQKGAFTYGLLEGLNTHNRCATVERLDRFLSHRVPELVRQYHGRRQTPRTTAEPIDKAHLILLPSYATEPDIALLKQDAYGLEVQEELKAAKQAWVRVLAVSPADPKALAAYERVVVKIALSQSGERTIDPPASEGSSKGTEVAEVIETEVKEMETLRSQESVSSVPEQPETSTQSEETTVISSSPDRHTDPQGPIPLPDGESIKSMVRSLAKGVGKLVEHLLILETALGDDRLDEAYWKALFDIQGATQAEGLYSPPMVRLLTLRAIVVPQTLHYFLSWMQRGRNKGNYFQASEQFQVDTLKDVQQLPGYGTNINVL